MIDRLLGYLAVISGGLLYWSTGNLIFLITGFVFGVLFIVMAYIRKRKQQHTQDDPLLPKGYDKDTKSHNDHGVEK